MTRENFSTINFKYTDAKNEKLYTPEVLQEAYVDLQGALERVLDPDKYIVYGDKGSGKTAIGCYYELKADSEPLLFAKVDDLEDFDFSLLSPSEVVSDSALYPRTIGAWKFLLATRLFALFAEDQGLRAANPILDELLADLDKRGLLPTPSLTKLATSTLESGAEISFKFFVDIKAQIGSDREWTMKTPSQIGDSLVQALKNLRPSEGRYLLFVDGLDHVLRHGRVFISRISDLISAVRIINETLLATDLNAKIVIMIRDEVAHAIPNPDLSKRLIDNGVLLDWYRNTREPFSTDLLQVIARRAALAGFQTDIRDLWYSWLPRSIFDRPSPAYVLSRTRFLPRDLIRFFSYLQQLGNPPFVYNRVMTAERLYSQWFYNELSDSLSGLVEERIRANIGGIISELGRFFTVKKLHESLKGRNLDSVMSGDELANVLFDTHWIGNYRENPKGERFYVYKCRNRSYGFSKDLECVVSEGLIRGLNINWSRNQQKA